MPRKKFKNDWRVSKKLLPGQIVIFSSDSFKKIYIGITSARDPISMNNTQQKWGYVLVSIDIKSLTTAE